MRYTAFDMRQVGYYPSDLLGGDYTINDLRVGGYSAREIYEVKKQNIHLRILKIFHQLREKKRHKRIFFKPLKTKIFLTSIQYSCIVSKKTCVHSMLTLNMILQLLRKKKNNS
jgi:hypothetical protein